MIRLLVILPFLLAACGASEGPLRIAVPAPPEPGSRVPVSTRSLEVRTVELPLYAELEEIYVLDATGALRSDSETLWADDPRRAVTQSLVRALSELTSARVASEPWPLDALPQARLEVRFDQALPQARGLFVLSGRYYVAGLESGDDRTGSFDIEVPFTPDGPGTMAAAKGEAIGRLARQIAEEAL